MASTAADTMLNEALFKQGVQKALITKLTEMVKLAREELKECNAEVKRQKEIVSAHKKALKASAADSKAKEKAAKEN